MRPDVLPHPAITVLQELPLVHLAVDGVQLATVTGDHADGDQVDGLPVGDELQVIRHELLGERRQQRGVYSGSLKHPRSSLSVTVSLDCRRLRSEVHTSELQSLMRISYAVFCLKKKIDFIYQSLSFYTFISTTLNYLTVPFN